MDIHHVETPALILDQDLFETNIAAMQALADANGLHLRPHYKSHKCPWIAHRQVEAGAKGITCATLGEAEDLAAAGIEDILIANVIPQSSKVARIASLAGGCRLAVCVDNPDNIEALEAAAAFAGSTVRILVEYDVGMHRCGVADPDSFLRLARMVEDAPHLSFGGIQAYAGHLAHETDYAARKAESEAVERRLIHLKQRVEAAGLRIGAISGSSTGTVEFRSRDSVYTEMQPGSYVFMDRAYGRLNLTFSSSLFLLTEVVSVASGERIVTCGGTKCLSLDQARPVFESYPDMAVGLSEEHCVLPFAPEGIKVGDRLRMIPGHCCTTVNLHDAIHLVQGEKILERLPVVSRGKSR